MYDSVIRTLVPLVVGALLGRAARIGLELPEAALTELVTVLVTAVYYVLARLVEERRPKLGRALLSFGLSGRSPAYRQEGP